VREEGGGGAGGGRKRTARNLFSVTTAPAIFSTVLIRPCSHTAYRKRVEIVAKRVYEKCRDAGQYGQRGDSFDARKIKSDRTKLHFFNDTPRGEVSRKGPMFE